MPLVLFAIVCGEVIALIKLGQAIGPGFVLLEIAATAVIGVLLMRVGGRRLARTQEMVALLLQPSGLMRQSTALLSSGLLLIVPGLLTDVFAIGLLVRYAVGRGPRPRTDRPSEDGAIDVEYQVQDDRDR